VNAATGVCRPYKATNPDMFLKRALVTLILLPVGLAVIAWGGWLYYGLIALILGIAAYEYVKLFQVGGLQPAGVFVIGATLVLAIQRAISGFENAHITLSLLILLAMTYHLFQYERGSQRAGTDFAVTLSGILYIGWLGAYLISLRKLPDGLWWLLTVLPAVWLADTGAYLVGSRFGRHKMTPRLSPKKSWEGYLGGILFSVPVTALLATLWPIWAGPGLAVTPLRAALVALVLSVLTILGDLGESMIKRQVGVKDSGNLLPGHGGAFDRIDSWLWAAVIGYYMITWYR
jgi:phosphatidate cytidylyltransferase